MYPVLYTALFVVVALLEFQWALSIWRRFAALEARVAALEADANELDDDSGDEWKAA